MFSIKRNKKGEIILDLQLNPVPVVLKVANMIDKLLSSKVYYSIPMGLGVGFGFAIVVFSNPTNSIANSNLQIENTTKMIPKEITIKDINFTSQVITQTAYSLIPLTWENQTISFTNFPGKTDQQVIIASKDNFINEVSLGENVLIEGSNNGLYQFSVYEIKEIESKEINNLMVNNQAKVIILHPKNTLGTKYLTALAK
ncbi:MAG: hypothetical protein GW941_01430 [Candidatus Pacebacteria bacterium]|nr:hypothetical protein [Candidatus Paceibacterota bacterium]